MVFALPKVLYGCVSHWAPRDELRSYDTRLRARLATLRRVSSWCRALQFPARDWRLQHLMDDALGSLGCRRVGSRWGLLHYSFGLDTDPKEVGHALRESWRRWHYGQLAHSTRHELRDEDIPAYDEARVTLVRKRARSLHNIGFIVATGGAMSAFVRQSTNRPRIITCSVCGQRGHFWHEMLRCVDPALYCSKRT